ncbi:MAG: pilus assembly protein [Gammaproteobacteria bacterium]|nr:pilus assembly protein [Gammaproteobacteria bacterium]NNF59869.1 pilus assembly protein [Gammaproteobacteria bacterium]NNM21490.1 pilus assembly protein [Gammaproteobacteria bacterium]
MNGTRYKSGQRGIAAVELAIVLPVLLLMMLAIAELGRAIVQYNELTKASRDAARYLASYAIAGTTDVIQLNEELVTKTQQLLVYGRPGASSTAILPGLVTDDVDVEAIDSTHVRVAVEYEYQPMLGTETMPMFGIGSDIDIAIPLRASVVMRAL